MNKIVIFVNGKARQIEREASVEDLVGELKLKPSMALIEHNGRALLKKEWPEVSFSHGDRLEILRVVAGG